MTVFIDRTYDVTEESGHFYITADDEIIRNYAYPTSRQARRTAERFTASNTLWKGVFEIEGRIAEALADQPWPYGSTCVNQGTDTDPTWLLTEPYRNDDDAVRIVNPDPTGRVQITVYTRDLYETACRIAGFEPDDDDHIKHDYHECKHGHYVPDDTTPENAVKIRLGFRRSIGLAIEHGNELRERADRLEAAGLLLDTYTRDQYKAACQVMGIEPLTDGRVMLTVTVDVVKDMGIELVGPNVPMDDVATSLAYRRAMGMDWAMATTDKETPESGDNITTFDEMYWAMATTDKKTPNDVEKNAGDGK